MQQSTPPSQADREPAGAAGLREENRRLHMVLDTMRSPSDNRGLADLLESDFHCLAQNDGVKTSFRPILSVCPRALVADLGGLEF